MLLVDLVADVAEVLLVEYVEADVLLVDDVVPEVLDVEDEDDLEYPNVSTLDVPPYSLAQSFSEPLLKRKYSSAALLASKLMKNTNILLCARPCT